MKRLIEPIWGVALASLIFAGSAEAKLDGDVVRDAEAAKAVAKVAVASFYSAEFLQERPFAQAKLSEKTWTVTFTSWDPLAPLTPLEPGEIRVAHHCGFCIIVKLSKHDAKVSKVYSLR